MKNSYALKYGYKITLFVLILYSQLLPQSLNQLKMECKYSPINMNPVYPHKNYQLNETKMTMESFTIKHAQDWGSLNLNTDILIDDLKPWESEKHFWVGAGEIAILEFIPWALASRTGGVSRAICGLNHHRHCDAGDEWSRTDVGADQEFPQRQSHRDLRQSRGRGGINVAKLLGARQTFPKPLDMEQLLSAVRYELAH